MTSVHFRSWDDAVLRALFEQVLELKQAARTSHDVYAHAANAAGDFHLLVEGLGGWITEALAGTVSEADYTTMQPAQKRQALVRHLTGPLMQPGAKEELRHGLLALNDGQVANILEPSKSKLRREGAFDAMRCRLDSLCRIQWRCGQGWSVEDAQQELAEGIAKDISTIRSWRKLCVEHFGSRVVESKLNLAEQAGEMVGKTSTSGEVTLTEAEMEQIIKNTPAVKKMGSRMEQLTLAKLKQRYRAATTQRIGTKP